MQELQGTQTLGDKRPRSDSDNSRDLPGAKRFVKQPSLSHPFAYRDSQVSKTPVLLSITDTLGTGPDRTSGPHGTDSQGLFQSLTQSTSEPEVQFHQFSRFPLEIRLKIWRETWEHRKVGLTRKAICTRVPRLTRLIITHKTPAEMSTLYLKHIAATRRYWGVKRRDEPDSYQGLLMEDDFHTRTSPTCKPPMSLWVNQESRRETAKHFEYTFILPDGYPTRGYMGDLWASTSCRGGWTCVLFNFDLDILAFPLHSPLSTAFSRTDLFRLRRVSFPELVPVLPEFVNHTGAFDQRLLELQPRPAMENPPKYPEFDRAWRFIQMCFPSLREIRLEPFYSCGRYSSTKAQPVRALGLVANDPNFDPSNVDRHCNSCMNIQNSARTRFRRVGIKRPADASTDYLRCELDRMLDHYGIMEPIFKQEKLVIGTVPGAKEGEKEEVTVTFQTIHEGGESSDNLDLSKQKINWDYVKRKCVARSLLHSLGPPLSDEYMVYNIGSI
ncbi:hypothetical protein M434DRAFT_32789 [Hypoxylon sp. CO27-5]|nr:hypothetical protein M434DRAFT_32789 [Hypoxylon sp. CO27-5]